MAEAGNLPCDKTACQQWSNLLQLSCRHDTSQQYASRSVSQLSTARSAFTIGVPHAVVDASQEQDVIAVTCSRHGLLYGAEAGALPCCNAQQQSWSVSSHIRDSSRCYSARYVNMLLLRVCDIRNQGWVEPRQGCGVIGCMLRSMRLITCCDGTGRSSRCARHECQASCRRLVNHIQCGVLRSGAPQPRIITGRAHLHRA
jgi:hypothetical protein